jgi:hypothetical protein
MAGGKKGSSVPPSRRRPAPTIDLKATEIASEPVTPSQPIDPPVDTPQPEAQSAPAPHPGPEPQAAAFDGPEPAPAPAAATIGERLAAFRDAAAARLAWSLLGAAAIGAGVALCMLLALWVFGAVGGRADRAAVMSARVAQVEQQVRDLAARPQPTPPDPRPLADLAARLAKLETSVAAPQPAVTDPALAARIAALETALRPLAELGPRVDAIAAAQKNAAPAAAAAAEQGELTALAARLAALEQAEKIIEQRIARPSASGGADQPGRIAFVAMALRAAAERGDPFAQELAAAKALVPDAAMLAPLEPYAATGVPRPVTLARELSQVAPAMLNAAGPAREGGIIDRLQQNAERLVRIRPISEGTGDEPATIVARAELKAAHGDIAGALAEVSRLPEAARAPAQGWTRKAEMQIAALAAARRFAETAVDALAKAAP